MQVTGLFGIESFATTGQSLLYAADHLPVYFTQQSFFMLTFLLPKWIAWLGLFAALTGWLHLLTIVWDVRLLHEIKFDSFNFWILVTGVALLRLRGSVSPTREE